MANAQFKCVAAESIERRIDNLKREYRYWLDCYKSDCIHVQARISQASFKDMATAVPDWIQELPDKYAKLQNLQLQIETLELVLEKDMIVVPTSEESNRLTECDTSEPCSCVLAAGKTQPQGENPIVLGIIEIVESMLKRHNIQIPDELREDSTDPIVGCTFAELHDNIRDYLVDTAKL